MAGRPKGLTLKQRFEDKYSKSADCWGWSASTNRAGYGQFRVGRTMVHSQRVSWELYRGPIPDGLYVLHRCDNRRCVNPGHLFLGTNDENMADMVAKERQARGNRHGRRVLTEDQIPKIRDLEGKMSQREIAEIFGVSPQQISHILRGVHWRVASADPVCVLAGEVLG